MNKQVSNISYIRNFFRDKISLSVCCLSLFILIAGYFVLFQKKALHIFPDNKNVQIKFYSDSADNGNSSIESFIKSDSLISMDFILKKGFIRPYVGIDLTISDKKEIDISDYNQVQIEALGRDIKNIVVYLITNDQNDAKISKKFPFQYYCENIELTSEKKLFKLDLSNFKIPDWWFDANNISPTQSKTPNWKRLVDINFGTGLTPTLDKKRTLSIFSMSFTRDNTRTIFYMFIIQFGVLCLLVLLFIIRNKPFKKISPITINYKAVSPDDRIKLNSSFLDYINNNFQDSELTLEKVAKHAGIKARHISETISDNYFCNFKTYINQIRINESKRLLKETNLEISEIAYKVGFSSPNNFNRVFKNLTGKNPSEFLQSIE